MGSPATGRSAQAGRPVAFVSVTAPGVRTSAPRRAGALLAGAARGWAGSCANGEPMATSFTPSLFQPKPPSSPRPKNSPATVPVRAPSDAPVRPQTNSTRPVSGKSAKLAAGAVATKSSSPSPVTSPIAATRSPNRSPVRRPRRVRRGRPVRPLQTSTAPESGPRSGMPGEPTTRSPCLSLSTSSIPASAAPRRCSGVSPRVRQISLPEPPATTCSTPRPKPSPGAPSLAPSRAPMTRSRTPLRSQSIAARA